VESGELAEVELALKEVKKNLSLSYHNVFLFLMAKRGLNFGHLPDRVYLTYVGD